MFSHRWRHPKTYIESTRRLLSVLPPNVAHIEGSAFDVARISTGNGEVPASPMEFSAISPGPKRKRRKSVKGWDGEINIDLDLPTAPDSVMNGQRFCSALLHFSFHSKDLNSAGRSLVQIPQDI
jgi:hypothetical protein